MSTPRDRATVDAEHPVDGRIGEQRAFWEQFRRGLLQLIAAVTRTRPHDRFTLDVQIVERQPR